MKWNYEASRPWHRWFAWYPVRLRTESTYAFSTAYVWLEWVERKIVTSYGLTYTYYRLPED